MPDVKALAQKYHSKGLVLYSINVDGGKEHQTKVQAYLDRHQLTWPVLMDDFTLAGRLGAGHTPYHVLVNAQGQVLAQSPDLPQEALQKLYGL